MSILNMLLGGSGGGDVITEVETGEYTPSQDYYRYATINFAQAHTREPDVILLADTAPNVPTGAPSVWFYANWDKIFGGPLFSSQRYGEIRTRGQSDISLNTSTDYQTYVTSIDFKPRVGTMYFRNNRVYKWIAFWLPSE